MSGWVFDLAFVLFFLSLIVCISSGIPLMTALVRSVVILLVSTLIGVLGTVLYDRLIAPTTREAKRGQESGKDEGQRE